MQAEWENWLLDENMRCKQVQVMLRDNKTNVSLNKKSKGADEQKVMEAKQKNRVEGLKRWHEEYCGSCKTEQNRLLEARKHVAFG